MKSLAGWFWPTGLPITAGQGCSRLKACLGLVDPHLSVLMGRVAAWTEVSVPPRWASPKLTWQLAFRSKSSERRAQDRSLRLSQSNFRCDLPPLLPAAAVGHTDQSPDAMWEGTTACGRGVNARTWGSLRAILEAGYNVFILNKLSFGPNYYQPTYFQPNCL